MKLRLRTLIKGSKTVEHAGYNLSYQLTQDAIMHLQPEVAKKPDTVGLNVSVEAYLLNGSDRARLMAMLGNLQNAAPEMASHLEEIRHVIGITNVESSQDVEETAGWDG